MHEQNLEVYPCWETDAVELEEGSEIFIRGTIGESDQGAHYRIEAIYGRDQVGTQMPEAKAHRWSSPFVFRAEAIGHMRSAMVSVHLDFANASWQDAKEVSERIVDHAIAHHIHLPDLKRKWLRHPDLWWEHVPVIKSEATDLGDQWSWHKRQLEDALAVVTAKYPGGLRLLPASGFYVNVGRWIQRYRDGTEGGLITIVSIWENEEREITYPRYQKSVSAVVHSVFDKTGTEKLGTEYNPLPSLLAEVVKRLPEEWAVFRKWRGRNRREPEAEWLSELRAQERKAKPGNRPLRGQTRNLTPVD